MTFNEFTSYWNDYSILIDEMMDRVLEAKIKGLDASKSESRIESIRKLQNLFHRMYHEQTKHTGEDFRILSERDQFLRKISQLEKEIIILKENINLTP